LNDGTITDIMRVRKTPVHFLGCRIISVMP
jgi:hypothetical protein